MTNEQFENIKIEIGYIIYPLINDIKLKQILDSVEEAGMRKAWGKMMYNCEQRHKDTCWFKIKNRSFCEYSKCPLMKGGSDVKENR